MCYRPSTVTSVIVCPVCGTENARDAKTCKECGNNLEGLAVLMMPVTPPVIPGVHNLPSLTIDYPELPGSSVIRTNIVGSVVNDSALWRLLKKAVVTRKDAIDCWYASPVTALFQDPKTKAIVGVEVEHEGRKLNIAARKGVILSSGGFQNNPLYTQQFIGYPKMLPVGTLANVGDGIRMAQAAGARLWHMNAWQAGGIGLAPEQDRIRSMGNIAFFRTGSCILVGKDARRYIAEDKEQRHGKVGLGGSWVAPARPDLSFFIFDENQRLAVASGETRRPFPNWSDDLNGEVEAGKIIMSQTIEGLAGALALEAEALQATIEEFNQGAISGYDLFGRKPDAMRPFGAGPYYGMIVFPSILATQGGPERTAKAEVVDTNGNPIPHLYAAGELGGITARNYQGGDSLAECVIFGKIAGETASAEAAPFVVGSVSGGFGPGSGEASAYDQVPDELGLGPKETIGIGEGMGGPLWVKVASTDGVIDDVTVIRHTESPEAGAAALGALQQSSIGKRAPEVDLVSGATVTSLGFKKAVAHALSKALQAQGK